MDDNSPHKLSTSALAKALEVPAQLLFSTLKDFGWIRKLEQGWELSTKGEFEGGEYVHSKRYGRYIVWPESLSEHPLLQAVEDNRHTSATAIGRPLGLSAREVNRVLAELAWIKHGFQGWEVTALGEARGGVQLENDSSGTCYVVWPQAVDANRQLNQQLQLTAQIHHLDNTAESDLFAAQQDYQCIDGHRHASRDQLQICHWLYMTGFAHACQRRLPIDEELYADFYLPVQQLYIECWNDERGASLSQRMKRKEHYQQLGFSVIDIEKEHLAQLDEVLSRHFRKLGIRVY